MAHNLQAQVAGALTNVRNARVDNDVISAGMVQDLVIEDDGRVSFTFVLARDDPATLVREARRAVREVEGVTDVKINVVEPSGRGPAAGGPSSRPQAASAVPATPVELPELGAVIAVSSGKGGVGKSTVAANIAVELAHAGRRVALMDADVYGPNIPRLFGVSEKPSVRAGRIRPLEKYGVRLISLGLLIERDMPAIWRGPIVTKIIHQFLRDVDWGTLDYFFVDLPPGTGDAQLSLAQAIHMKGGIIVTTPQEMAAGDALRGAKMFERVGVPVIGIVENMSYFICPHCDQRSEVFSGGGGQRLADELGVPLLGQVPLQAGMTEEQDTGKPVVVGRPKSPAAQALAAIAQEVAHKAGGRSIALPIITG
ncbi:MAG: P-loop NTPase [Gemmatimonadales bacterium]|nr:P-loop NTPase [Gemmatimonadales bacterium]NIN12649.1 P-loop NTPase [Gemmatimonadales bacterium]NIR02442.1 P-loop NTPase [Gemmatimonadales bacterium]NIS66233.1 P-loop NTPase [Gemmatimonadales bacterium]